MIFHGFSHDRTEIKMWGKPIVDDGFIRLYNEKLSLPDLLFSAVRLTVIVFYFFFQLLCDVPYEKSNQVVRSLRLFAVFHPFLFSFKLQNDLFLLRKSWPSFFFFFFSG